MRHGKAEDFSSTDLNRRLTEKGIFNTMKIAKHIANVGLSFDRIISSGYVRANETAKIISDSVGYINNIEIDKRLVPNSEIGAVSEVISENSDCGNLLFVFHEPIIGEFIRSVCSQKNLLIEIPTSSLILIDLFRLRPMPSGSLEWFITPKIIS